MATKITTSAENEWLIKRLAISCTFFFSMTDRQRRFMNQRIGHAKDINTADGLRAALQIQPRAWSAFMDEFFKQGGVIREWNRVAHYGQVQLGLPDSDAFKHVPLPGDKDYEIVAELTRKLADLQKQKGGQPAPEGMQDESKVDASKLADALAKNAELEAQNKRIEEELKNSDSVKIVHIELKQPKQADKKLTMVHKTTPELLVRISCGLNVYLVGPAGSGKTTAAEKVSEALGLAFGFMSVGPQTTKSDVFGYMDAKGEYVKTEFRRRYEEGGVFLFDEIDAAHAGVLTQVNAALAGSCCAFPDAMIKRHADFRCVAAGNTFGTGPDRVYVGRQELDGASLDRFDFIEWGYDESLEREIAKSLTDNEEIATKWTAYVQAVRKAVQELGIRHIVSPRATMNGVKLLSAGVDEDQVRNSSVFKSLKPAEIARINTAMVNAMVNA